MLFLYKSVLAVTTIHVGRRVFDVKKVTRISLTEKLRFTNLVFISILAAYLNMFLTLSIFVFFSSNKSVADFPSKLQVSVRKLGFWEMNKKAKRISNICCLHIFSRCKNNPTKSDFKKLAAIYLKCSTRFRCIIVRA